MPPPHSTAKRRVSAQTQPTVPPMTTRTMVAAAATAPLTALEDGRQSAREVPRRKHRPAAGHCARGRDSAGRSSSWFPGRTAAATRGPGMEKIRDFLHLG